MNRNGFSSVFIVLVSSILALATASFFSDVKLSKNNVDIIAEKTQKNKESADEPKPIAPTPAPVSNPVAENKNPPAPEEKIEPLKYFESTPPPYEYLIRDMGIGKKSIGDKDIEIIQTKNIKGKYDVRAIYEKNAVQQFDIRPNWNVYVSSSDIAIYQDGVVVYLDSNNFLSERLGATSFSYGGTDYFMLFGGDYGMKGGTTYHYLFSNGTDGKIRLLKNESGDNYWASDWFSTQFEGGLSVVGYRDVIYLIDYSDKSIVSANPQGRLDLLKNNDDSTIDIVNKGGDLFFNIPNRHCYGYKTSSRSPCNIYEEDNSGLLLFRACANGYYSISEDGKMKDASSFFSDEYKVVGDKLAAIIASGNFGKDHAAMLKDGYWAEGSMNNQWPQTIAEHTLNYLIAGDSSGLEKFDKNFTELSAKYPIPQSVSYNGYPPYQCYINEREGEKLDFELDLNQSRIRSSLISLADMVLKGKYAFSMCTGSLFINENSDLWKNIKDAQIDKGLLIINKDVYLKYKLAFVPVDQALPHECIATGMIKDGSADLAGLMAGDVIFEINGQVADNNGDILDKISNEYREGEIIRLKILRGAEIKNIDMTLERRIRNEDTLNYYGL